MSAPLPRRIVLVGCSGSGKSSLETGLARFAPDVPLTAPRFDRQVNGFLATPPPMPDSPRRREI